MKKALNKCNLMPLVMESNSSNKTGIIGVSWTKRKSPLGKIALFFTVSWRPEPNIAKNKSFFIASLGEEKAFELAVKYRKAREREIKAKAKKIL